MSPFNASEDIERKTLLILKILNESRDPIDARLIARRMQEHGVIMSERTAHCRLRLMDGRRLTDLIGKRDGRVITDLGAQKLEDARVRIKSPLRSPGSKCRPSEPLSIPGPNKAFSPSMSQFFPSRITPIFSRT